MGAFVPDHYVPAVQSALNLRFAPGDAIKEMVALQRDFDIFSPEHALSDAAALLGIALPDAAKRDGWFRYLDSLREVGSDTSDENGHDRVVRAIRENLEARAAKPIHFTWHLASDDNDVQIDVGEPLRFSAQSYLIISVPLMPAKAGGARRAKR